MQGSMPGGPYRTDGLTGNPIPLPCARGFGAQGTNIPSRGMGPKGPLPGGFSSGIHGKIMPWAKPTPVAGAGAGRPNGMGRPSASGVANVPSAASYGWQLRTFRQRLGLAATAHQPPFTVICSTEKEITSLLKRSATLLFAIVALTACNEDNSNTTLQWETADERDRLAAPEG